MKNIIIYNLYPKEVIEIKKAIRKAIKKVKPKGTEDPLIETECY